MTRVNTPTDNAVAERFMRTLKEHKIDNTTIEEDLSNDSVLSRENFSGDRALSKVSTIHPIKSLKQGLSDAIMRYQRPQCYCTT